MMNANDTYVTIEYKSGAYIGKAIDVSPPRTLVEIMAVLRHPMQGDLHHPYEPDVPMFHERRASSHREKVWVPTASLKTYEGDVPAYDESLRRAWEQHVQLVNRMIEEGEASALANRHPGLTLWAEKALVHLRRLESDYWG